MRTLSIDANGWFTGAGIVKVPSKRTSPLSTKSGHVDGMVSHWTATKRGTAANLAKSIAALPTGNQRSASWHVCIEHDGTVYQSASCFAGTWHAGGSTAALFKRDAAGLWQPGNHGVSANRWALGVEMVSVGEVRIVDGQWRGWPYKADRSSPIVAAGETLAWRDKRYHAFTPQQEEAFAALWQALKARWGLLPANAHWGHADIDPTRKTDPGPYWAQRVLEIVK